MCLTDVVCAHLVIKDRLRSVYIFLCNDCHVRD
jgi:hypothetical protein